MRVAGLSISSRQAWSSVRRTARQRVIDFATAGVLPRSDIAGMRGRRRGATRLAPTWLTGLVTTTRRVTKKKRVYLDIMFACLARAKVIDRPLGRQTRSEAGLAPTP